MNEPLTRTELDALADADLNDDPRVLQVLGVLYRANAAGLVFGGDPSIVDPTGWTRSTLPAVAVLIADDLADEG